MAADPGEAYLSLGLPPGTELARPEPGQAASKSPARKIASAAKIGDETGLNRAHQFVLHCELA